MTEEPLSIATPFPGTVSSEHQPPKLLDRVRIAIRTHFNASDRGKPASKPSF